MRKSSLAVLMLTGALWFAWGILPFDGVYAHAFTEFDDTLEDPVIDTQNLTPLPGLLLPPKQPQKQPETQPPMPQQIGRFREIFRQLGLSPQQRQQVRGIMMDFKSKTAPFRNEIQSALRERQSLQQSTNPKDRERLSQIEQKLGDLKIQGRENRMKIIQDVSAVLTPEQRKRFQDLVARHRNQ
jgi:Spy/CpxP family protein refolding chaperone